MSWIVISQFATDDFCEFKGAICSTIGSHDDLSTVALKTFGSQPFQLSQYSLIAHVYLNLGAYLNQPTRRVCMTLMHHHLCISSA